VAATRRPGPLPEIHGCDRPLLVMLCATTSSVTHQVPGSVPSPVSVTSVPPHRDGCFQIAVTDNGIGVPAEFA